MPASKTTTKKAPARQKAPPMKPAARTKSTSQKPSKTAAVSKPKGKVAPARGKAPVVSAKKPAATRRVRPAGTPAKRKPASPTITVGETQYVLGEYGQLITMEEYERLMGTKLKG